MNRFTRAYKTRFPIVNAAMAFLGSTHHLAAAVMDAGGMGTIAVGVLSPEQLSREVSHLPQNLTSPLNINLIVPFASDEHIDALLDIKPSVASFHWGPIPEAWIQSLSQAGIHVWEQIGSAEAAVRALDDGVDAVIAQGLEAGGHNLSTLPTFVLVPEVVEAVKPLTVLAGGGITNGQQVAAALALGADAVWVGSRFITCPESQAHPRYQQEVLATQSGSRTVITNIYGRETAEFNPLRVLSNSTSRRWHGLEHRIDAGDADRTELGSTLLNGKRVPLDQFASFPPTTVTEGQIEDMALSCGQGVGCIRETMPAKDIVFELMQDAQRCVRKLGKQLSS
ncbi:MAG: nitronate monooxygenase [Pseudomonadota bacterium]